MAEKSTLPTTYIPRGRPANEIVPRTKNENLQRAQAAFARISHLNHDRPRVGASDAGAQAIADSVGAAVRQAVVDAMPYGRPVDVEMDIAHQGADGSATTARLRLKCGGYTK